MAAKSAMENGASVIVVEKASKEYAGGSAATSLGFLGVATTESVFESAAGRLTMETAQRITDEKEKCMAWLTENGLELNGSTTVGFGPGFYSVIVRGMESLNTNVLYETPAKKLIADPQTKEVYGIQCVNAAGEELYIRANKGVILCTGGYLENDELMTRFHFADMIDIASVGAPTQTGDGHLMADEEWTG